MSNGGDLLRMLEPAIRPANLPAPTVKPNTPIESRDFDSILDEARGMNVDETRPEETETKPNLMDHLSQIERVENATLRQWFETQE